MATLERAIAIAAGAHAGVKDKAGAPYLLHPLRIMLRMETDAERIVAVLHDVVEDTPWTFSDLKRAGFAPELLRSLRSVTKRDGEGFAKFVRRAEADPIGRRVKLADIEDNMDVRRLKTITKRTVARLRRYQRARRFLLGKGVRLT